MAIAVIIVGFGVVSLIFDGLVSAGIMDDVYGEAEEKRKRTIWLISICANLLIVQFFNKKRHDRVQRGIAFATVLAAFSWLFYYRNTLFFAE